MDGPAILIQGIQLLHKPFLEELLIWLVELEGIWALLEQQQPVHH
jgi:hypothetical protein